MKKRKIKIIGDSLAAGGGSSLCRKTDKVIIEDNGISYLKCVAPNSWWGLLEAYLRENGDNYLVDNMGCGGAYSYQIKKFLNRLVEEDDDLVLILMGVNDRKRVNGMEELRANCENVIDRLTDAGKEVVLLTPTPSVHSNEYYPNRIHHTDQVVDVLRAVAEMKSVHLIDLYRHILKYLDKNCLTIDDIMYGEGCVNDGLHPADRVHQLMFEKVIGELML